MLATVRDAALFEEIRRAGLQRHVWQWQSFAAFCQYRRVHEATVRYLRPGALALDWGCGNGHFPLFSVGVLEHVHKAGGNARGSILELERVLKPGGHFPASTCPIDTRGARICGRC